MYYKNIKEAEFIQRMNRFVARVLVDGAEEAVHVKNTGRLGELLVPGARVVLSGADDPKRKTRFDLIGVWKDGRLFNIDSQAPNAAVREWLEARDYDLVKPEYRFGDSRIDFYMEKRYIGEACPYGTASGPAGPPEAAERWLLEVKGCTLDIGGTGYFPDAPTERGIKHIHELTRAASEGWHAAIAFVIQMKGVEKVLPNDSTQPEFGAALRDAQAAGVEIWYMTTDPKPDRLEIVKVIKQVEGRK